MLEGGDTFGCDKEEAMTTALRWSWVGDPLPAVSGLSVSVLRGTLTRNRAARGNQGEKHMSATKFPWSGLALAALLGLASAASAADVAGTRAAIDRGFDAQYPHIEALYKDIHSHPELAFQETRTAARLAAEMRALGYEVTEGIGKTGLVALYKNGPGPTVMVRTELDALPMPEKTGLPHASTVKQMWRDAETPVAHSCGHDIHMAAWVAVAKTLIDLKDQWNGTVMFVAQPAEEGGGGARPCWRRPVHALRQARHGLRPACGPGPCRSVTYRPGSSTRPPTACRWSSSARRPRLAAEVTIEPVMIAGQFIVDVQSVISRQKDPAKFRVVDHRGCPGRQSGNVIPDTALLRGTIRSYDDDTPPR